ncbi:hypothetical protein ABEV00_19225 [Paenibacillus thiaminolyticus]|uniref:hypothetical protein n=1 Tax=Paenibacillus thiaminolyticus TaxID=49283 RepID=UPI003D296DCA
MSPHPEELLQIYIILGPFASSRNETGEIPAVVQDSPSGKVVHIELLYLRRIFAYRIEVSEKSCSFADFAYRIYVSREIVQFSGRWKTPVFYEGVEIVHFPTQNLAPIAF